LTHLVYLSRDFEIQTTDVTQAQYIKVMGNNPSHFQSRNNCPESFTTEWEFAARGGSQTAYSFGSDPSQLSQYAWFDVNSGGQTHAVASLKPNTYGLYDMHGNVWQWVQDYWDSYFQSSVTDPQGPASGSYRIVRGGRWFDGGRIGESPRSAKRRHLSPDYRASFLGFRLVRTR
jgi:formylglycine-generating enzyme required for sulfatase activity